MTQRWILGTTVAALLIIGNLAISAGTKGTASKPTVKRADKSGESVQRAPRGVFDLQRNVVSNIDLQTTNYGIVGFDVLNNVGGTFWPRGRRNQYIFAGGAWFGTRKRPPGSDSLRKRVMITYNPNSGTSWMVPGTIEDGEAVNTTSALGINKYRTYFSTDFSSNEGVDFQNPTFPRWPLWDTSPTDTIRYNNYYGDYVSDPAARLKATYKKGPAFISEEDIFCTYKDTDLDYYEGGITKRKAEGFPLGMQIEQIIYSWGFGDYADFMFLKYLFIHPKKYGDTLFDCWMAAVQDVDIALQTNSSAGAQNDRARYYTEDPALNLAVQWTNPDRGEAGQGFGYLGFNFLESPAIGPLETSLLLNLKRDGERAVVVSSDRLSILPGDYVRVNDELLTIKDIRRYKTGSPGDTLVVGRRGLFGTVQLDSHFVGAVVSTVIVAQNASITAQAMSPIDGAVQLASGSSFVSGDFLSIGDEVMLVTGGNGDTLSVLRSQLSTSATSHDLGAQVSRIRIPDEKFLRKDKKQFALNEQLGLQTMRNWPITEDPIENEDRYNFISRGNKDEDNGPGDRRLMMATGPFNMRPGDSARIVVGIILAGTVSGGDATGTTEDLAELIRKVKFAQFVYDNQFRAPKPPETSIIKGAPKGSANGYNTFLTIPLEGFLSLNNSIAIQWDSTSELSIDTLERGLDFMGYRIYRARRTDQDTFAVDYQANARKGPLSWKQISQFDVGSPFSKEGAAIGNTGIRMDQLTIADVIKPGQKRFLVARTPNFIQNPWSSYFAKLFNERSPERANPNLGIVDPLFGLYLNADGTVVTTGEKNGVANFDRLDSVLFTYLTTQIETLPLVNRKDTLNARYKILIASEAKAAKDSLVKLILLRRVRMDPFLFPDVDTTRNANGTPSLVAVNRPWEETNEVRSGIIARYIREQSKGRVLFDIGDDDRNGVISYSTNPEACERLINNIDYTYAIRAYDEGDYLLPTQSKLNNRAVGLPNVVTATPLASRPGAAVSFSFTTDEQTKKKLGGVYNVRLLVDDPQRFNQMFAGRTLELEFFRQWAGFNRDQSSTDPGVGLYGAVFVLRDSLTREILNQWSNFLPPELCPSANVRGLPGYFAEDSWVFVDSNNVFYDTTFNSNGSVNKIDSTTFGLPDSREKVVRSGTYTSNANCFTNKYAFGALGIAFDYSIEQWGGSYRPDTAYVVNGPANMSVSKGPSVAAVYNRSDSLTPAPAYVQLPYPGFRSLRPWPASYNNGPGIYEVTFKEGGTETLTTKFLLNKTTDVGKDSTMTFPNVPYLTYEIKNVYTFDRTDIRADGTAEKVPVGYDLAYLPQLTNYDALPPSRRREFPAPTEILVGSYGSASFGWRNARIDSIWSQSLVSKSSLAPYAAELNTGRPLGQQLRYYKSRNLSTTGKDTLDFINIVTLAGVQFSIDFAGKGRRNTSINAVPNPPTLAVHPDVFPTEDFKAGDKVRFTTLGGAFGFPFDSAKAYIRVAPYDPYLASSQSQSYTDENLEQVQVVPNPYYVTHEGMSTPFQGLIYFTRLPRVCTISIYTVNGALVQTIQHNELTSPAPDKVAADVWNLFSSNRQRVASQMLVAKIETPEGASVIRKFSVVVGPARIIGVGE